MKTHQRKCWAARAMAMAMAAGALTACGGSSTAAGGLSDLISLAGFAMKGNLSKAKIEAFVINNGMVDYTKPAATGLTDANSRFSLTPVPGAPGIITEDGKTGLSKKYRYVLRMTPASDGSTQHTDEATGSTSALPGSSALRLSAVAPVTADWDTGSSAVVTVNLTPFSHQAVQAAINANGGLSDSNISQASAVVNELYGFDPVLVKQDDKALKVLLTAVSQMNQDGSLNCMAASTDPACTVNALAAATQLGTLKLATGAVDVSTAFSAAIQTAVANLSKTDPSINNNTVLNAVTKLGCTGTACTPTNSGTGSAGTSTAITNVKALFTEVLTDLRTLFSNESTLSASSTGAFNQQAFQFKQTVQDVAFDMGQLQRDMKAVLLGVRYYQDVENGTPFSTNGLGQDAGNVEWTYGLPPSSINGEGCTLYQDVNGTTPATNPTNANYIGCSARFGRQAVYNATQNAWDYSEWRHGFTLTPDTTTPGKFSYTSSARRDTWSCPAYTTCGSPIRTRINLVTDSTGAGVHFSGTVTASPNSAGVYTGGMINGALPPGFVIVPNSQGFYDPTSVQLATDHTQYTWNLQVAGSGDDGAGSPTRWDFGGNVAKYNGDALYPANRLTDLTLKNGSFADKTSQTARLDLTASVYGNKGTGSTNTATLGGVLTLDTPITDKSGTQTTPGHMNFVGTLSNTPELGTTTTILQGGLDLNITGYEAYDATQPDSASNTATLSGTFTGSVTAPGQPRLELVLGTTGKTWSFKDTVTAINLVYNRYSASGTKTRAVNLAVTRAAPTNSNPSPAKTLTLTEASSGLQMVYTEGGSNTQAVAVTSGGKTIGSLDTQKSLLTFSDGTLMSLVLWP